MAEATQVVEQPAAVAESAIEDRIVGLFGPGDEEPVMGEDTGEAGAATDAPEQGQDSVEGAAALEEVEWEGEKVMLPPKIKSALMAQSDYTRKTQELADQRRVLDAQVMLSQQEQQFQQSVSKEMTQLNQLDWQIEAYRRLDWSAMDTDTMTRTRLAFDQIKDQRNELAGALQAKRDEFGHKIHGLMQQARTAGQELLKRAIPNWGPDVGKGLVSYGLAQGFSDVELNTLTDTRMITTLWKAQQWDTLQSQKAATTKRAEQVPPVRKPGAVHPNSAKALNEINYRKQLAAAKTPGERQKVIGQKFGQKLFGG